MTETKRKKLEIIKDYAEAKINDLQKDMKKLNYYDASELVDSRVLLWDMQDECDLWIGVCTRVKRELKE